MLIVLLVSKLKQFQGWSEWWKSSPKNRYLVALLHMRLLANYQASDAHQLCCSHCRGTKPCWFIPVFVLCIIFWKVYEISKSRRRQISTRWEKQQRILYKTLNYSILKVYTDLIEVRLLNEWFYWLVILALYRLKVDLTTGGL